MANITFAWMVDRVREATLLKFDDRAMGDIMTRYLDGLEKLISREVPDTETEVYRGWGVGPIRDSYSSQGVVERIISGEKPRTPGQYLKDMPKEEATTDAQVKPGESSALNTQEYFHPVVAHATDPTIKRSWGMYEWPSKNGFKRSYQEGQGWVWKKEVKPDSPHWYNVSYWWGKSKPIGPNQNQIITIPEFVIPSEDHFPFPSLERSLLLTRPTAPMAFDPARARKDLPLDKAEAEYTERTKKWFEGLQKDARAAEKFLTALDKENGYEKTAVPDNCICWMHKDVSQRLAQKA